MTINSFLLLLLAHLAPKTSEGLLDLLLRLEKELGDLSVNGLAELGLKLNLRDAGSELLALRNLLEEQGELMGSPLLELLGTLSRDLLPTA